jgi:hypothetical protein
MKLAHLPRALVLLPLLALGACQSSTMSALAPAARPASGALAFVAVQGPDAATATKFQNVLAEEAKRRGYTVEAGAQTTGTQVKTFLDGYATPDGKTGFSWVLDASGDGRTRHARTKGTALLGAANSNSAQNPWAAFDDAAMRQVARMGLDDLTRQMQGSPPTATSADE